MVALFSILPIFGFATLFYIFLKRSVSVSIFFSISFIITILFIFGMLEYLKIGGYLLFYGGTLLLLAMAFIYAKDLIKALKTVPFVMFTLMSIVYLYMMQDAQLFFWDEYSHWGAFIKEMYYFHSFYDASSVAAHLRYPPGISIWDYFIILPTGFKESSIYFAYFLILFSSVLMMYEKLQWRHLHWIVLVFAMQMIVFATYGHWFSSIYVDHIIGALFAGMILSYLTEKYSYKELLYFIFPAISIVLVKEIGLFFTLSFVGLVFIVSFYNSMQNNTIIDSIKDIRKILFVGLIIFISAFLALKFWNARQDSLNVAKEHQTISGIVKSIVSEESVLEKNIEDEVKKRFWEVVNNQQLHKEKVSLNYNEFSYDIMSQYEKELKLSTTGSFIFFLIMISLIYFTQHDKNSKRKSLIIGGYLLFVSVVYLFILFFSFQVGFGNGALRIPSYVRYMNMAMMPLLFLAFFMLLPSYASQYKNDIFKKNINIKLLIFILILAVFTFITKPYFKPLYSQLDNGFRKNVDRVVPSILEHIPAKSKVLVVFPIKNNGSLNNILKYSMIPTNAAIVEDDFFAKKSEQEVLSKYAEYDFIWFVSLNQNIANKSKQILKQKNENQVYTLYKLLKQNNQVEIKPLL